LAKTGSGVDNDYTGTGSGTVAFAVGESSKEISFTVNGDYYKEVNQKIVVNLSNAAGGEISKGVGIGEINDVDVSSMGLALSLRDLRPDLSTFAVRVRRSSDNTEQDIGFDEYGNLDQSSLLQFVNGNSNGAAVAGAMGYVSIWYDQSGNGSDATQTNAGKQGVIVSNGVLQTANNGNPTITFNAGLNGANDDFMSVAGNAGTVDNIEIYLTLVYQLNTSTGMVFNIGTTNGNGRIGAHAPHTNGRYYWDAGTDHNGRLDVASDSSNGDLVELVFTANKDHGGSGTAAKNFTDADQAIFSNGAKLISRSGNLWPTLATGNTWYLMSGSADSHFQSGKLNNFMVFASDDLYQQQSSLVGTHNNDSITYAGESSVTAIDGREGYDVVKVSSATSAVNLDASSVSLANIELINMQNGQANQLTINDAQITSNGSILSVLMDTGDSVVYNTSTTLTQSNTQEVVTFGLVGNDSINMSALNEVAYGRGGDDVFVYKSWSDSRTDGVASQDTIKDFTLGASSGDRLDLRDLLSYTAGQDLSSNIEVTDVGGNVTIKIDKDGAVDGVDFTNAHQTIVLEGVGTGSINLNYLDDYAILL